jgi:mannose-6-phosphate isomerase-like protein (cupin superfamily)
MEKVSEHEHPYRDGDHGVKYLVRGPKIDWGVIRLRPGDALGAHYHNSVEETFYVISGAPTMIVNGEELPAKAGDVFRIEPADRHDIVNGGEEVVDLVFIKCPFDKEDKVSC